MEILIFVLFWALGHGEPNQCAKLLQNAAYDDQNTIVETSMKTLNGIWLSEGCETRPGPEYVLRYYTFYDNGNYKLVQHHYWDNSCSSPKLTIISIGVIKTKRDSILYNDALTGEDKPSNITVIPQDFKSAKELDKLVSTHCPGQYWKSWRKYEEHVVFRNTDIRQKSDEYEFDRVQETIPNTQHYLQNSSGALSCLGSLRWTFNEIKLIKIQLRPSLYSSVKKPQEMHWELLLGDIPSRSDLAENYVPTGFQAPLVKTNKGEKEYVKGRKYLTRYFCTICSNLGTSDRTPPHLIEKAKLPPYIWGEWVSQRCEVRPMGLYLTRQFSFYNENNAWVGEHKFYVDPFCALSKFVVVASGNFEMSNQKSLLKEAFNIDFHIAKAVLTIHDQRMMYYMPWGNCGKQMWKVGLAQELADTNGCEQLGIRIPSVQYDVVKVEMSYHGYWLLFLGQADTENIPPRSPNDRPTAFQPPLVRCGESTSRSFLSIDYEDSGQAKMPVNIFVTIILFIVPFCR